MAELPSGTVTFLFSDIEGSTRLLQRLGDRWGDVVAAHNEIMRRAFADAGGREVDRQGDAFFAVFPRARNALAAAATIQRELAAHDWPEDADVLVRMGVHTGEPALGDEGYLGLDVVRAARICSLARGGQVLVSETTRALVRSDLDGLSLQDVGEHRLKDIDDPERLFRLEGPGLRDDLPVPAAVSAGPDTVMGSRRAGDRAGEPGPCTRARAPARPARRPRVADRAAGPGGARAAGRARTGLARPLDVNERSARLQRLPGSPAGRSSSSLPPGFSFSPSVGRSRGSSHSSSAGHVSAGLPGRLALVERLLDLRDHGRLGFVAASGGGGHRAGELETKER